MSQCKQLTICVSQCQYIHHLGHFHSTKWCLVVHVDDVLLIQPSNILKTRAAQLEQYCFSQQQGEEKEGKVDDIATTHSLNEYAVLLSLFGDARYIQYHTKYSISLIV